MPVIETLVKVVLALAVVAFVGYPFLKEQWGDDGDMELPEETEELYRRKESTYSALKELEFDYKTGKLSEQDYRELEARYKAEAIEILEAIDQVERPQPKSKGTRVGRPRGAGAAASAAARSSTLPVEAPSGQGAQRAAAAAFACASCGGVNPDDARFCASCGEPLEPSAPPAVPVDSGDALSLVCDACGSTLALGHRFCGSCGMQVQS